MEHLALEIFDLYGKGGSQYAYLPEDTSITITDTSEVFASGDVWSHSFTLNVKANSKIFGTAGDMHGGRLHEQLNGRRARLWVEGLPLYLGYLKLDDEVDVDDDGNVDVTFESGQKTFKELIEGGKANQVPMMSNVQFGMALWRKRWTCVEVQLTASIAWKNGATSRPEVLTHTVDPKKIGDEDESLTPFVVDGEDDNTSVQQYPRMVFPKGTFYNMDTKEEETVNFLNTDSPYDDNHPYCNIALCYQKSGYTVTTEENGTKFTHDDYTADPTKQRGYEVMPANRVNSAPNFFVIYWLRALMKHLGIYIEENQMMDVEDLRRLFFVNTNCAYEETQYLRSSKYDGAFGKYQFGSFTDDPHHRERYYVPEYFGDKVREKNSRKTDRWNGVENLCKPEDCGLECKSYQVDSAESDIESVYGGIDHIDIKVKKYAGISQSVKQMYNGDGLSTDRENQKNMLLHRAIASSECFPNADISEVINALKNGFGVRLLFDDSYQRVRIVLLRNIFRNKEVQDITCDIVREEKTENSIRGFKMTYGVSDDTQFKYKGFDDLLPHKKELWIDKSDKHDYSRWDLSADYKDLIHRISAFDVTCYVTPNTGNAYGIKVDKNAKTYNDLHPSLFEYAGYMDAEDGDCTGEKETIKEINVGFKPAIMNDCNFEKERDDSTCREQLYALFVDEDMRPRRPDLKDLPNASQKNVKSYNDSDASYSISKLYDLYGPKGTDTKMVSGGVVMPGSFGVHSDMYVEFDFPGTLKPLTSFFRTTISHLKISGHLSEGYRLYLQDNFEPNDDGICPIEKHDWGLTLGIMRGSGKDAYVNYTGDPDDGEDNDTWDVVPGSNATCHPDTCDSYGNLWDYNGGSGETLHCTNTTEAVQALQKMWPNSNISLLYSNGKIWRDKNTYICQAEVRTVKNSVGNDTQLMFATVLADNTRTADDNTTRGVTRYAKKFNGMTSTEMYDYDKAHKGILVEVGSSFGRRDTLLALQQLAFNNGEPVVIDGGDNGTGVTEGRFSLKLRAEKLNPYYAKGSTDAKTKDQYLPVSDNNLKGRGLCDQFYKEYSYWVRNARIAKLQVNMELAQFLAIDKTKRVKIGSYEGFIKKMQFTVSNKTGLGLVTVELMYI